MTQQAEVVVVGAGLAGLTAARELRSAGVDALVCEAEDEVGGRIRTDVVDGFRLDRGFQVLLPGYPAVRSTVRVADLRLRRFTQGVIAGGDQGRRYLAPPWRHPAALRDLAEFARRRPRDVAALAWLSARDTVAPARIPRARAERSTADELAHSGVSDRTVDEVLRPFLAGVFLDPALRTSSRVFHLIWRAFLRGGGALPAAGMGTLPHLVARDLDGDSIRYSSPVTEVHDDGVTLEGGERIPARVVIVATDGDTAARLLPTVSAPAWHSVTTFYYRVAGRPPLERPTLLVDSGELVLNTAVISAAAPGYAPPGSALVAASVPERADADPATEARVRTRLARLYDTTTADWDLIRAYPIRRALPVMTERHPLRSPVRLGPGRYVCGDHRDTSSQQGALTSGKRTARAVLHELADRSWS